MRLWSEIRSGRAKELAADAATLAWLMLWIAIAWSAYQAVVEFADAGRKIRGAGETMIQGGRDLGAALGGVPLVGDGLRGAAEGVFAGAGTPISAFGTDLEGLIVLIGTILAVLILLVPTIPWLTRYVPWRWARLRAMRAGHRAIRVAPTADSVAIREVLALRAVTRLGYGELLDFTPDPIGDWIAGRHDRLAQAELASVGLTP